MKRKTNEKNSSLRFERERKFYKREKQKKKVLFFLQQKKSVERFVAY